MSLIDKIRKAREQDVKVGGYTFTVRRPTDIEAMAMHGQPLERMLRFVVGWRGVNEIDLIPGGSAVQVDFDADLAVEWLADRPDLLEPITAAIRDASRAHVKSVEDVTKN